MFKKALLLLLMLTTSVFAKERKVDLTATKPSKHLKVAPIQGTVINLQTFVGDGSIVPLYNIILQDVRANKTNKFTLIIDSPGGYVDDGLKLIRIMKDAQSRGVTFNCLVDNAAYSMAAIISTYCDTVYMRNNARLMFHEIAGGNYGKTSEVIEDAVGMYRLQEYIDKEMSKNLGLPLEVFKQLTYRNDWYVSAEDAAKFGMVDGIFDSML